jgi:hypothetical protein
LIFESDGGERYVVTVPRRVNSMKKLNEHLRRSGVIERAWPRLEVNCAADDREFAALVACNG